MPSNHFRTPKTDYKIEAEKFVRESEVAFSASPLVQSYEVRTQTVMRHALNVLVVALKPEAPEGAEHQLRHLATIWKSHYAILHGKACKVEFVRAA